MQKPMIQQTTIYIVSPETIPGHRYLLGTLLAHEIAKMTIVKCQFCSESYCSLICEYCDHYNDRFIRGEAHLYKLDWNLDA